MADVSVGAKDAYEEALKVEPGNAQAKSGLKAVDDAIAREASEDGTPDLGLGKVPQSTTLASLSVTCRLQLMYRRCSMIPSCWQRLLRILPQNIY